MRNFLDFSSGRNKASLLNNLDWLKDLSLLHFLRDIGKYISIGHMMAKESVKQRLDSGISYTEFGYQLLQGYDFYHLYLHQGVTLQMGGSDKWGNLTTGVELIRKKAQGQAFALTTRLLTRADGSKFGKTASGENVSLDPAQTSPYALYQFLLNSSDQEAERLIRIFANAPQEEVEASIIAHQNKPGARLLQQQLAQTITTMVHSAEACSKAMAAAHILFSYTASSKEALYSLSEVDLLALCETIVKIPITSTLLWSINNPVDLLSVATDGIIMPSKSEARRIISSGGIRLNKVVITNLYQKPDFVLLHGRYLLVQKGKKNHYLIVIQ